MTLQSGKHFLALPYEKLDLSLSQMNHRWPFGRSYLASAKREKLGECSENNYSQKLS
jgi:hypothetical protein